MELYAAKIPTATAAAPAETAIVNVLLNRLFLLFIVTFLSVLYGFYSYCCPIYEIYTRLVKKCYYTDSILLIVLYKKASRKTLTLFINSKFVKLSSLMSAGKAEVRVRGVGCTTVRTSPILRSLRSDRLRNGLIYCRSGSSRRL